MSRVSALIAKLDTTLKKVTPLDRTVYKRTVTRTGGDSLTGKKGTVSYIDTLLSPQPYYKRLGRERSSGHHAPFEAVLDSTTALTLDEYEFIISPTAMTLAELENPDIILVLKDSSNHEESFRVLDIETPSMNGTIALFTVYARSMKRP